MKAPTSICDPVGIVRGVPPTTLFLLRRIAVFSLAVRDIIAYGHACGSTAPKYELLIDGAQRRTRVWEYEVSSLQCGTRRCAGNYQMLMCHLRL